MTGSDEHPWHGVPIIPTPDCPLMAGPWDTLTPNVFFFLLGSPAVENRAASHC